MTRFLIFAISFVVSTGVVVMLCGGFAAPVERNKAPAKIDRKQEQNDRDLYTLSTPDTRGVYIGDIEGMVLRVQEERIVDGQVRQITQVHFRYESVEPRSQEAIRATGLEGHFHDENGVEIARVKSERGLLRFDGRTNQVSMVLLEGDVFVAEIGGDKELASLQTETLEIRFPNDKNKEGESLSMPKLRTNDRVEIRKEGLTLTGKGFEGETELRNFRLARDVELIVDAGGDLALPDMMGTPGAESTAKQVRITSPDALVLEGGKPEDEDAESDKSPRSSADEAEGEGSRYGIREAKIRFVGATVLEQGTQRMDAGALDIDLEAAGETGDSLEATQLLAREGVTVHESDIEMKSDRLVWKRTDGPPVLQLIGSPSVKVAGLEGNLLEDSPSADVETAAGGFATISCRDKIVLLTREDGGRGIECTKSVVLSQFPREGVDPAFVLVAEQLTIQLGDGEDGTTELNRIEAYDAVEIRDPEYVLAGGHFELDRTSEAIDLVMSRNAELRLEGGLVDSLEMDLMPGTDAEAEDGEKPDRIVARAGDRIVLSRKTSTTTYASFEGGCEIERSAGETIDSTLRSNRMLLAIRKNDQTGKSSIASWNAAGDVEYVSVDGRAEGDVLTFSDDSGVLELKGDSRGNRALFSLPGETEGEEQRLLAERLRYDRESDTLKAYGRVEGEFESDLVTFESVADAASGGSDDKDEAEAGDEARTAKADPESGDDEAAQPVEKWKLLCAEADLAFVVNEETEARELAYLDARRDVLIESENHRLTAQQITYSKQEGQILVHGDMGEPADGEEPQKAVASIRNTEYPEEWDALTSDWMRIDTNSERITCPDGGRIEFHVEDLLKQGGETKVVRYLTSIECVGALSFQREREARFDKDVVAEQRLAAGEKPVSRLTCDSFRAIFRTAEEAAALSGGDDGSSTNNIRKALCEGNVKVRHPRVIADGDRLELDTRSHSLVLEGDRDPVHLKTPRGDDSTGKWIRYDYETGDIEAKQVSYRQRGSS